VILIPWFKVDDTLAFHMKTVKAGNAAMGLWVRAGSWSMQTLSDGYIPDEIAAQLGTAPQAKRLVEVGLWDRLTQGYGFHEWEQRQPTKVQVHADRADSAERQRASRERRKKEREAEEKREAGRR
jgi:hypothetical protein